MNATLFVDGLIAGGRSGARTRLTEFWHGVPELTAASPLQPSPLDRRLGTDSMDFSPA